MAHDDDDDDHDTILYDDENPEPCIPRSSPEKKVNNLMLIEMELPMQMQIQRDSMSGC